MTVISTNGIEVKRQDWVQAIADLEAQIRSWAESLGWTVETTPRPHTEEYLGQYVSHDLVIRTPEGGRVHVEVKSGGSSDEPGRVRIFAWPTLYRVHLIRRPDSSEWIIRTDSGIPFHRTWNRETFAELVRDLLAAN